MAPKLYETPFIKMWSLHNLTVTPINRIKPK